MSPTPASSSYATGDAVGRAPRRVGSVLLTWRCERVRVHTSACRCNHDATRALVLAPVLACVCVWVRVAECGCARACVAAAVTCVSVGVCVCDAVDTCCCCAVAAAHRRPRAPAALALRTTRIGRAHVCSARRTLHACSPVCVCARVRAHVHMWMRCWNARAGTWVRVHDHTQERTGVRAGERACVGVRLSRALA